MLFKTQSGSVYELDAEAKRIRRVSGVRDPEPRQGKGGEWRTYLDTSEIRVGNHVVISWDPATTPLLPGSPPEAHPCTVTSRVVEVVR